MNTYVLCLFSVLAAAPDAPATDLPDWCYPHLKAVAVSLELMDSREALNIARPDVNGEQPPPLSDGVEVDMLRQRWADLKDAPPMLDLLRLPDARTVNDAINFNRAYLKHLTTHTPLFSWRQPEHADAVKATNRLYNLLDAMRDARMETYYVPLRRRALATLRWEMGSEAYYEGGVCWPTACPVPLQYFREVR